MGVVFSMLWRLGATAACVAVFVVALGSLWLCVALAKPSDSTREYERLEELLGGEKGGPPPVTAGGGRKEGKKRRSGKAGSKDTSPRSSQSPRNKRTSPETVTPSGSGTESGREEGEGGGGGGGGKTASTPPSKQEPAASVSTKETVTDKSLAPRDKEGGDFKLVTSKSPRGKKDPAPIVTTSSLETGGDKSTAAPVSKKKKQEELKAAASKNASSSAKTKKGEKGEIPVVTTIREKGEIPVVRAIAKPEDETPQIPEIDVSHPVTTTETTYKLVTSDTTPFVSKGDVGGVGKKTRRKGGRKRGQWDNEEGATSEKVVSSGSGEEGERKEGEWHTQLSRQQLRALRQKQKERVMSQQKTTGGILKEDERDKSLGRKSLQRREGGEEGKRGREEGGRGGVKRDGGEGRGVKREGGGRVKRERGSEPKGWNLPNTGVVAVPTSDEATPSAVAASAADEAGEGPVAHSNTTDLEKAMREAAFASSSSSEDIASLQTTTASTVTNSNSSSLATDTEAESTLTVTDNVVFPSATVATDTVRGGPSDDKEAIAVSQEAESPDTEDWVVLEPPTS